MFLPSLVSFCMCLGASIHTNKSLLLWSPRWSTLILSDGFLRDNTRHSIGVCAKLVALNSLIAISTPSAIATQRKDSHCTVPLIFGCSWWKACVKRWKRYSTTTSWLPPPLPPSYFNLTENLHRYTMYLFNCGIYLGLVLCSLEVNTIEAGANRVLNVAEQKILLPQSLRHLQEALIQKTKASNWASPA